MECGIDALHAVPGQVQVQITRYRNHGYGALPGTLLGGALLYAVGEAGASEPYLKGLVGLYILVMVALPRPTGSGTGSRAGQWTGIGLLAGAAGLAALVLLVNLLAIALIDWEHMIVPHTLTVGGMLLGLVLAPWSGIGLGSALVGGLAGAGIVLLLSYGYRLARGQPGMGGGDVLQQVRRVDRRRPFRRAAPSGTGPDRTGGLRFEVTKTVKQERRQVLLTAGVIQRVAQGELRGGSGDGELEEEALFGVLFPAGGELDSVATRTAMVPRGGSSTIEEVLMARKSAMALVATPLCRFSLSSSTMALSPKGVAALPRPSMLEAKFMTMAVIAG